MARKKKAQRSSSSGNGGKASASSRKRKAPAHEHSYKNERAKKGSTQKEDESDSEYVSETDEESPAYTSAGRKGSDDELDVPCGKMVPATTEDLPKTIFSQRDMERTTKAAVQSIVSCSLWPRVKFVDADKDLRYTMVEKTICRFVIDRSNLPETTNKAEFWDMAKKWVKTKIAQLRSDKSVKMRFAFLGKCLLQRFVF